MSVSIIIPARLDSSRLWGKALLPYAGIPALRLILQRTADPSWNQILAVSEQSTSDPIADHARLWDIDIIRGSHDDVLGRVLKAAEATGADTIVRATCDNPMLNAQAVREGLSVFRHSDEPSACNLGGDHTYDPEGYFVDIASANALHDLHAEVASSHRALKSYLFEHVTLGLKEKRSCKYFSVLPDDHSHVNWSVDRPQDYLRIHRLFTAQGAAASAEDALEWTRSNL